MTPSTQETVPSKSTKNITPHSSAAFLNYLHNGPSSHHVTLSATASRQGSSTGGASGSPHAPQSPPLMSRRSFSKSASNPGITDEPVAGPSSLRRVGRAPSLRRNRPSTAPPKSLDDPHATSSPEMDQLESMDTPLRPESPMDELTQLAAAGDACIVDIARAEITDARQMFNRMSLVGGDTDRGSTILGRAGSLVEKDDKGEPPDDEPPQPAERMNNMPGPTWKSFGKAYARGMFDPLKIPNPPEGAGLDESTSSTKSSPGRRFSRLGKSSLPPSVGSSDSQGAHSSTSGSSTGTVSTGLSSAPSTMATSNPGPMPGSRSMAAAMAKRKDFELNKPPIPPRPDNLSLPSYSLAAATVRMAATGLRNSDFSPLSIPSPERELNDPLASYSTPETGSTMGPSSDPGSSRLGLSRSLSSTIEKITLPVGYLPTIAASPLNTPNEHPGSNDLGRQPSLDRSRTSPNGRTLLRGGIVSNRIPPASAPLEKTIIAETTTDYFGAISPPHYERHVSHQSGSSSNTVTAEGTPMPRSKTPEASPPKPEPEAFVPPTLAQPPDLENLYDKLGWLPAPVPPNELARRKALYRFNILHTAPDVHFDRIAHMAKLVFSTKIVAIALIDADRQWYKVSSGLETEEVARFPSLCAHTLLGTTAEPLVVLDTLNDWRFANNPNVIGPPHIRFYAGAPLRTSDGFNLGSLCIIDDKPRQEFTPRSRLILKEFAAVTMREMELWRDKLQLRVRDRIQTSMEKFTRECLEMEESHQGGKGPAKMEQVYARAAQLVCSTLDMDGCFVLDISQFEMMESEGKTVYRADPYVTETSSPMVERNDTFGPINALPVLAATSKVPTRPLTAEEHEKMSEFLRNNKDGKIFEGIAPAWIRYGYPQALRWGMVVPIFGVDQQPFAMLCAYTTNSSKQYLEGYELQFLRAIGVIILSAVLRRRMVLADKTKSILISSVSHELRTPLHGILASAELLSDTPLDSNQQSFLKTVQTCGNSLIETVNHVLDFTKLSGSTQGNSGSTIRLARVNLAALVEQTVEGCVIGQRARLFHGDSDIGSFYAPPAPSGMVPKDQRAMVGEELSHVETVIDISLREKGWMVRCEKGGLRRVLMNLVGNSLKFTKDGYVRVTLRELPHPAGSKTIPIEMAVIDTGKGIGKDFLKDQLFHPFSQENPLQTGTGLGLAIVNSIVRSENVNGKVDVWSSEGMGTEIRVSFEAEVIEDEDDVSSSSSVTSLASTPGRGHTITFRAFEPEHRGHTLSLEVLSTYAVAWGFELRESGGDVVVINEDDYLLPAAQASGTPIIILKASRSQLSNETKEAVKKAGGSCQIMYKPIGPSGFRKAVGEAVDWLEDRMGPGEPPSENDEMETRPHMSRGDTGESHESQDSQESNSTISDLSSVRFERANDPRAPLYRRRSEEHKDVVTNRPSMAPRGMTYHAPRRVISGEQHSGLTSSTLPGSSGSDDSPQPGSPTSTFSTISLADGGVMLKAAQASAEMLNKGRAPRVLVVEDNIINRRVLGAFLKKRGYDFAEAYDGQMGLDMFEQSPPNHWDVILMDISMPIMDGITSTRAIRKVEATRRNLPISDAPSTPPVGQPVRIAPIKVVQARAKIFALTGLATHDDKRNAFGSGVDGYLTKPVALRTLDSIFTKLGFKSPD